MDTTQLIRQSLQAGRYDALQTEAFTPQQVNKASVESGQAMGFRLKVEADPIAEYMDAMEELTMLFEDKEMQEIGDRQLSKSNRTRSPYFIAVQAWQKVFPDMPGGEFMERMLRMLRLDKGKPENTSRNLLKRLAKGSSDPSHIYAMLECLEDGLTEGEDIDLLQLVREARKQLENEKGAEVRAGLNLAEEINSTAKSPEEMQDLRDLYRSEVLGFKSPQECFRSLLANRGAGRLADSIDFLVKSCGIDLQSPSPSQSAVELRRILTDLQCVNVLKTILDSNTALAEKMKTEFGEPCLLNGERLTGRIMDFTEMPHISSANIASLVSSCGIEQLLAQLYFCTELLNIFHKLSPRLFNDAADRFKLIDAGQEHLDGLVSLEEEAEEKKKQEEKARK